jgi:hypothetical protein
MDALAGMLRCDAASAGRYLSRLARAVLAGRLRPAAAAATGAPGSGAAGPAFATGRRVAGDGPGCESSVCEHDCHRRERSPDGEQAAAQTGT